jgi:hypothetical protein
MRGAISCYRNATVAPQALLDLLTRCALLAGVRFPLLFQEQQRGERRAKGFPAPSPKGQKTLLKRLK